MIRCCPTTVTTKEPSRALRPRFAWTALEFRLRVPAPGTYTLFVRWSSGDTVGGGDGGGDSFYALVTDEDGDVAPAPL